MTGAGRIAWYRVTVHGKRGYARVNPDHAAWWVSFDDGSCGSHRNRNVTLDKGVEPVPVLPPWQTRTDDGAQRGTA